jgi:dTMP kinase
MIKGKFITLEGGEGVGKSSNATFIKEYLGSHGITVTLTREPGGTPLAEKIRQILLEKHQEAITDHAELLMMFAARAQHIQHVIYPALQQGHWVLSDRFTDATYAYQGGGRNMDMQMIAKLENMIQGTFRPDLTLLLDAPVEIGMKRARKRGALDRFEIEHLEFFQDVRRTYLVQAELYPERIKIINAAQSLTDVQKDILDVIYPLLS